MARLNERRRGPERPRPKGKKGPTPTKGTKWLQAESRREERAGTRGALRRKLGVTGEEKIPTSRLRSIAKRLSAKAKGAAKKLTASEMKLSRQVQMALRYRGS